ncbi:MAG: hypothetical protein RL594_303 [Bacteroidota bacterium]
MNSSGSKFALLAAILLMAVIANSCSSVSVPRSNMRSTDASYRSDLEGLQNYIDTMPADIVVAGYPKDTTVPVTYTVDTERMQTTYRGVVVKRITPEYTVFRSRSDTSRVVVVPTKTLSRVSIDGVRKKRSSTAQSFLWLLLPIGAIAFLATWGWRNAEAADASTGYRVPPVNSCLVILAIIVLAAATLVVAVSIPVVNALLGEAGTYERVSQTWLFQ